MRLLLCLCLLALSAPSHALRVLGFKFFDQRVFCIDVIPAKNKKGNKVSEIVGYSGGIFAVNGGYFGTVGSKNNPICIFPIGTRIESGVEKLFCPVHPKRGVLYCLEKGIGIGYEIPENAFSGLECGPILVYEGKLPKDLGWFKKSHWNRSCSRTVVAKKGNLFYFFRFNGNLWDISKYLQKKGFQYALNLDGGSSVSKSARVANAVVVFRQSNYRPYKAYLEQRHNYLFINQLMNKPNP